MKILVTGAAGFLGAATVKRALAAGHSVRAMIRKGSPRDRVALPDPAIVYADLTDPQAIARAVEGLDAVIHCAATTSAGAPDEALSRRTNVEGTRLLYEAAKAAGVRRWVQISSMSAHPGSTSVYGRTKLGADEVLRAQPSGDPVWTILRPSLIYGPGGRGLVAKTVKILKKIPVAPVIGPGTELIRPIYVDDVADAALACLTSEIAARKTYTIGGADEVTLNEFMAALIKAAGLKRPIFHLPIPVALMMAKTMAMVLKNPPITADNVLGVREVQRVEHEAALQDLAWKPMTLDEGLRMTFRR